MTSMATSKFSASIMANIGKCHPKPMSNDCLTYNQVKNNNNLNQIFNYCRRFHSIQHRGGQGSLPCQNNGRHVRSAMTFIIKKYQMSTDLSGKIAVVPLFSSFEDLSNILLFTWLKFTEYCLELQCPSGRTAKSVRVTFP